MINTVHKFIVIEILPKRSVSSRDDDSTSDVDCSFALEDVITADSDSDTHSTIPSFVDHRYAPRNVKRREQRKNRKIALLRKEMKSLKNKLANSERVISRLKQDCRTIKEQKERSLNRLKRQYDLSILDFMKLDAERNDLLPEPPSPPPPPPSSPPPINLETKEGKRYSPIIRTLYYSLLASQVPPGKISKIIRDVLVAFFPDVDASKVKLPAGTCANYMRREELKTLCLAQQATVLCASKELHLNCDGTTKNQRKLNATAFNGVVISVSEIADGKAETIIEDIDQQFKRLRDVASQLGKENHNMLNFSMIRSSTSDSASTQKRLNDLLEKRKEDDSQILPCANSECLEIVRNFCAMHLGVNLRKAFVAAQASDNQESIDTFVYEFCKLFGSHGTLEYAVGCVQFPDFLRYKVSQCNENELYYRACLNVTLSRQVGSRYFVTSHNATKIIFLVSAALEFLTFTDKSENGNKLEKDVFFKLSDTNLLTLLKADALMFHHIFFG